MKNLTGIISLFAIASLAVLAVASAFGVSPQFWSVASRIVGISWTAGVLAIFVTDYAPRRTCSFGAPVRTSETKRAEVPANARPFAGAATAEAMATLGLANDPATVSLV